MASSDQPTFPQGGYRPSQSSSSSIFYENEVKKDSEIMLRDAEVQHLLQQNRDTQRQHEQQQQHQQQQHQQQQLSEVKVEPRSQSPERIAAVSSTTTADTSLNIACSTDTSPTDRHRLSQSDRAHMCMTCFKGFRNKPQLTQHELVHNNIRKHVCSYCEKAFKQICHLNQHMRVHTGERPYKCDVEGCGRSFAQLSNLNHHKKNHEENIKREVVVRQFKCEVCERSYATKHSLNTHIQKVHSNLKALEGTVSNPLPSLSMTPPRKRKKSPKEQESLLKTENDSFIMECDSDEDGLPTQVKVKSSFESKPNLTVQISTPTDNGESDKSRQTPRTTLPLPFTSNQSQSSPMSLRYQQSQGQDDFITTFSNSVSQGQGYREMLQSQQSQNLYSQLDPGSIPQQNHPNINVHDNTGLLNVSSTNTLCIDGQIEERKLLDQLSKSEAIIQEQRELMQAALTQRQALLINRTKSNFGQIDVQSSQAASNMSQMQRVSAASVSLTEQMPMYDCQQGQVSQVSIQSDVSSHVAHQSDVPSHVAHHYPKINTTEQNRSGSHQIFNPAFTEQNKNISQNTYNQSQY